jgi:FHA domain-containing protein
MGDSRNGLLTSRLEERRARRGHVRLPVKTHSQSDETWRCDACGAFNNEPLQTCSECKAVRLDIPTLAKGKRTKAKARQPLKVKTTKGTSKGRTAKRKPTKAKDLHAVEKVTFTETTDEKSNSAEPAAESPGLEEPEPPQPLDTDANDNIQGQAQESGFGEAPDDYVVGGSTDSAEAEQESAPAESEILAPSFSSQPEPNNPVGDHFSLVYVNTPVPELIKRKVDLDFESFDVVSIGRSPENVVVIPDAGVSRTHAELRKEGNRIMVKDLQSSNGTYVYDGKEFQRVQDPVEVRPNTLVKLGTGTILRIVTE